MTSFTEKLLIEEYMVKGLKEGNWTYIKSDELEREDFSEPLLIPNIIKSIKKINNNLDLSEHDINFILAEIKSRPASMEGVKKILEYLKVGIPIKLEKTRELRYIQLIDYDNIGNNEFIVSNQVEFESPKGKGIPDIVLYVNGIPLVIIEAKNPISPEITWYNGYLDINVYYKEKIPELLKYTQFGISAAEIAKYFPIVFDSDNIKKEEWRGKENKDSIDSTLEMLDKRTLLDLIRNFIFVKEERGETNKVIARWMQYEAVDGIFSRVVRNLKGDEKKNSGLIWHWQGSGKTLTMIFAAYKLYREEVLSNPTIFFIVDRDDLETQLNAEFSSLDLPNLPKPIQVSSIAHLKEILTHDEGRGQRGLFTVLIQKFRQEDLTEFESYVKSQGDSILSRRNVIALVDEGHRTQYGQLATQMREILKNTFFFAFTGTPIAAKEKDTYSTFSYPKEGESYLHRYFIEDSIRDGFTVPIVFKTKLEKKINLDKELLETFIEQDFEEIPEEKREAVEKKVGRKLGEIVVRMKNPERVEFIANDIAKHFKQDVDGKFKGMVVAVDRESCIMYKNALDKILPKEYSEIVMTFNAKQDSKEINEFFNGLRTRFGGKQLGEIKDEIIEKFKKDEYPKILVVTDMLLTGFDAPMLQTMYLDKPLKGHKLLQAIARTNRPFKNLKEAGLIIDYIGIFKEYERALAMYNKEDVKYSAVDFKDKKGEFIDLVDDCEELFGKNPKKFDRESLINASRTLTDDIKKSKIFTKYYRQLRKLFGFLGYNETKDYITRLKWLTAVYTYHSKLTKRQDDDLEEYTRRYFEKALKSVYESVEIIKLLKEYPEIKIDRAYLDKLKKIYPEDDQRVYNMMFSLQRYVLVEKKSNPVYESIAEKVERIIDTWKAKKLEIKKTYKELEKLIGDVVEIEKRENETGLSKPVFNMLVILENKLGKSEKLSDDVKGFETDLKSNGLLFKGWNKKPTIIKEAGKFVRRLLIKYKIPIKERNDLYEKIAKGFRLE